MCEICQRVELWKKGKNPHFIHEFKHSILVLGDHQFYRGYSIVLFKGHERDITDLPANLQSEYLAEVMLAGKILQKHFRPYRFNYSCLGNFVEHIHFHIFPRYEEDLRDEDKRNPWWNSTNFKEKSISTEEAQSIAKDIRKTITESFS